MGCFDNIIGVGGCNEDDPSSVFYLKDAGISTDELGYMYGSDYSDGFALANDKIRVATNLVVNELTTNFSSKYIMSSFIEDQRIGHFTENKSIKAPTATLQGVDVLLKNTNSYLSLYVDKVQVHLNYTGNIVLKIYDVVQGIILDSFTLNVTSGIITEKIINKTYTSDKKRLHLLFIYDTTGVSSYETTVTANGCSSCSVGSYQSLNNYVQAKSVYLNSSTIIDSNIQGLSHTSGLSIIYSLKCNHEEWLCRYRNEIAMAIAYKAAAEIINYTIYQSSRANIKKFNEETLKERWNLYDSSYRKYLKNLTTNLVLPNDPNCFACKQLTKTRTILP